MWTKLRKRLASAPTDKPWDTVQHGNMLARMFINHDRHGKRYVGFSVHRLATVRGQRRRVNSFGTQDLAEFLPFIRRLCKWYLLDPSTPAETAKALRGLLEQIPRPDEDESKRERRKGVALLQR